MKKFIRTADKPVIFAFHHGYGMIRDIFSSRHNHNLRVHGYRENEDITTIWYACDVWGLDRHLAQDAANAALGEAASAFAAKMDETIAFHHDYIRETEWYSEVQSWKWENVNK